ncbi:molybdate ABC transporter permease subunit [Marinithermus hydrothermalis]|uniref:Molybdenum transport system permease n=1 Tax=Marinithermus hydrothermalis (strain DSM 14884 / JCM 11576 / T1) TaxID=869210 RepID=F2NME1_MARHT|nr:molybdate ABC transporter permease subunit [Marinithermus hydrothermalis]AEB11829.1 molybdate ABC transporter, inner membrane subunit [Marinithermus hydrothermalis DSM 14884]
MTEALWLSLKLAFSASLVLLVLGTPVAYLLARKSFRGKAALETLLLLPLTLPPTVLGYYLLVLLAPEGPIARWLGLEWAFRFEGMLLGSVIYSLPFVLTTYREAFRSLDADLLQTARTLGASRLRAWREVGLPLVWPGLAAGTVLAFAHTLGEFGVVLMIGGNIPGETRVASIYVYDLVQALDFAEAGRVSLVLLALSFALIYATRLLEARWRSRTPSSAPPA